ncbi:hypothetical protein BDN70DRAFT_818850, partial [Pholiota conissans]
ALHDSSARFDPPRCHPNTRRAILDYLTEWIYGRLDEDALIMWLYGPAGVGKSAILQTIAEQCSQLNMLLAAFFFGRSDPTRNTFKPLIPTLACQTAIMIPKLKPMLESAIERDPFIFSRTVSAQLQSLIVNPLTDLMASDCSIFACPESCARLIIIDGLDECADSNIQSNILQELAGVLRSRTLPIIFLIASRCEQQIGLTFNSTSLLGLWRSVALNYTSSSDEDIRLYLTDKFAVIKNTHPQ